MLWYPMISLDQKNNDTSQALKMYFVQTPFITLFFVMNFVFVMK